jgi:FkbM family methyltransferase
MILNLQELVHKYNMHIKGVVHVGAHFGEENEAYDKLNIQHRMFFEPASRNYYKLQQVLKGSHTAYNAALGNENTEVDMYIETINNGASNSILKPVRHLQQYPWITFPEKETVHMYRLDDIEFEEKNYNFINMDVQGYELEVLKGSVRFLQKVDYVMTEINRAEVYENCAKIDQLIDFLSPYGFQLVEQDWGGDTWGDGFFIKK